MAVALVLLLTSIPVFAATQEGAQQTRILRVGPGRTYAKPSDAARAAGDDDVIEIDAGVYLGDVAVWTKNGLTLRGVGGMAHLKANGKSAQRKAIWVIQGDNTTVENIEFSGAKVRDRNGAGIRQEGAGLTVRNCFFHDNQEGILSGTNLDSDILIEHSEFARNGYSDGQAHNLYIGRVRSFTLRFSYVHHAVIGSNVKSRALANRIEYNRIMDGSDGRVNYSIDLSDGGLSFIIGNVIQQGPKTENYHLITFAPEGAGPGRNELFVVNNTLVNDRSSGVFVRNKTRIAAHLYNNLFVGQGEVVTGDAILFGNVHARREGLRERAKRWIFGNHENPLGGLPGSAKNKLVEAPGFVAPMRRNYRLAPESPAIDAGVALETADGVDLTPRFEPGPPEKTIKRPQHGPLDAGAYEYVE